jgi:hypothetical protein
LTPVPRNTCQERKQAPQTSCLFGRDSFDECTAPGDHAMYETVQA